VAKRDVFTQLWLGKVQHDDVMDGERSRAESFLRHYQHSVLYAWYMAEDDHEDTIPRTWCKGPEFNPKLMALFATTYLCPSTYLRPVLFPAFLLLAWLWLVTPLISLPVLAAIIWTCVALCRRRKKNTSFVRIHRDIETQADVSSKSTKC